MFYTLHGLQLESECSIPSFEAFLSEKDSSLKTVHLNIASTPFCGDKALFRFEHKGLDVTVYDDGWLFSLPDSEDCCMLFASEDYLQLTAYGISNVENQKILPLLRTALECAGATQGLVSLHSSCIRLEEKAICFTANSGMGKSTRAQSWINEHGAQLLSGDRPIIRFGSDGIFACGAPWDGKEQVYVNDSAPLMAICDVRRGAFTRIRKLSPNQARHVLMQQCFIPMWDTVTAARVMALIIKLSREVPVYRMICGPDEEAAHNAKEILFEQRNRIFGVEKDMKIKEGFVLKSIAGENIVMPAGENIKNFDGAIVLNEVAAYIWSKLENGVSRNELIEYILSEFDVDADKASEDLDRLLERLSEYGVIDEETV